MYIIITTIFVIILSYSAVKHIDNKINREQRKFAEENGAKAYWCEKHDAWGGKIVQAIKFDPYTYKDSKFLKKYKIEIYKSNSKGWIAKEADSVWKFIVKPGDYIVITEPNSSEMLDSGNSLYSNLLVINKESFDQEYKEL